ncbi:MAG: stalk domain-containing protein [Clostridia bacterium]
MIKRRVFSLILAIVMTAAAIPAGFRIYGEAEAQMIERVFVTYEDLEITEEFGSDATGLGASYLSSDSRVKVVGPESSVMGVRSLAVNRCDMRWWSLNAGDQEMYVDLAVKADENFNNKLVLNITTQLPSETSGKSTNGNIITVTKQDGKSVILDHSGKLLLEMEEDVRYNIRTVFKRGSDHYQVLINSKMVADNCAFSAPVYTVDSMSITVSALSPESSAPQEPAADPYILIDNPSIYTKGRYYPQKFSAQEPGALPEINVPKETESQDIQVYVNTTKIEMSYAPVVKDDTIYVDLEQIARCIQIEFKEDKSKKTFELSNENVKVKATLDNTSVTINDKVFTLTAPPRKMNGTTMVTPNFLNEVLNAKVWWDEAGKMLVITTGEYKKDEILRNVGGKLYMNGEPYYEISFNKFDLYYQILSEYEPNNQYPSAAYTVEAAEAALKQLSELGFGSVRVFMYSGAYPNLMYNVKYQETYFKAMDQLFDLCDKYDIKIVVCLGLIESFLLKNEYIEGQGWITGDETVTELVTNPDCESRQNVYKYLEMFISRYKDRKSVLMWEIRNEGSLEADIGSAVGSVKYSLLQLAEFYGDCADKIRELDDHKHLITSGDSVLRNAQWNLLVDVMNGTNITWKMDTKEERLKALALLNEKLDLISVHAYGLGVSDVSQYADADGNPVNCDFHLYMQEAARLGKILYNGETNGSFAFESETFYRDTEAYLNSIIDAGVQLSHWWTFRSDRQGFNDGYLWRIDSGELLDLIVAANQKIKDKYVVNKAANDNTNDVWDDPMFQVFEAANVIDGKDFVVQTSFRSKMIRLGILCGVIVLAGGICVFALTREKLKKKRKKDIV